MKRIKYFIFLSFLFLAQLLEAQVAIGKWRDHLPYYHAISVTAMENEIITATEFSLFSYNRSTGELSKFSKIQGLSDTRISFAKYSPESKVLLVAYNNGNLDLIQNNQVFNLSDIYRAAIPGQKRINNSFFIDNLAYLSCEFGIVVLDMIKREFKDTYYIGENGSAMPIYEITIEGSTLWAATENGLYTADKDDPLLVDYSHWSKITNIPGASGRFDAVVTINNKIIANKTNTLNAIDTVYLLDNSVWSFFTHNDGKINSLYSGNNALTINGNGKILIYDESLNFITEINQYEWGTPDPRHSIIDEPGTLWIADNTNGLINTSNFVSFDYLSPEGPYTENVFAMSHRDNTLFVSGGGLTGIWGNTWKNGEIFSFSNGSWKNQIIWDVSDIINIASFPGHPEHLFAATWGFGVLEISDLELLNSFMPSNSSLQAIQSNPNVVRTCGLLFDDYQNLWVTNSSVINPVSLKNPSGQWKSFHFNGLISNKIIGPLYETRNRDKWITIPLESKLFVFNDMQTPEIESDDLFRLISVLDQEGRNFNKIMCLIQDQDGTIWLGTDLGPLVIYNPDDILYGGEASAQRIKIPRNDGSGLADYLLSTEMVTSIVIDGANRKWIGTKKAGAFLFSQDGTVEIENFNKDNSPLPSNWITSIAIDEKTGEVFLGTDSGILSYRGEATTGSDEMIDVYVFPNPVRENYYGPITITGLVSGANVKITDISGNLIFETNALGGQAIWDGLTSYGKRASTGIYVVFISNEDGSKIFVTKILFIN